MTEVNSKKLRLIIPLSQKDTRLSAFPVSEALKAPKGICNGKQ